MGKQGGWGVRTKEFEEFISCSVLSLTKYCMSAFPNWGVALPPCLEDTL